MQDAGEKTSLIISPDKPDQASLLNQNTIFTHQDAHKLATCCQSLKLQVIAQDCWLETRGDMDCMGRVRWLEGKIAIY